MTRTGDRPRQDVPEQSATANLKSAIARSVGARLDELVLRACSSLRSRHQEVDAPAFIPYKGQPSLPYCDAEHNPNLVRIYLDAQHDYLHNRIYLLGALVVAYEEGQPARRQHVVHVTEGPPDTAEKEGALFAAWVRDLLATVVALAAPDASGEKCAPLHLIFWNSFEQRILLEALSRNFTNMLDAAPALYDFVTQMAAFDSPIASFLDREIAAHKNYPMVCQSLQAVSAYLGFDWRQPEDYRDIFRERLFDAAGVVAEPAGPPSPPNSGGLGGQPAGSPPNSGGLGGLPGQNPPNSGGLGGLPGQNPPNSGGLGGLPGQNPPNSGGLGGRAAAAVLHPARALQLADPAGVRL